MTITYIKCAEQVITVKGGSQPRREEEMSDLGIIENGSVLVKMEKLYLLGLTSKRGNTLSISMNLLI